MQLKVMFKKGFKKILNVFFFIFFFKEFDLHINIVIKNNFKSFVVINKKRIVAAISTLG